MRDERKSPRVPDDAVWAWQRSFLGSWCTGALSRTIFNLRERYVGDAEEMEVGNGGEVDSISEMRQDVDSIGAESNTPYCSTRNQLQSSCLLKDIST
jgi:hypothetical protein